MATSQEIKAKAQRIKSYKKLLKIAKEGSFDVYFTLGGLYGNGKARPLNCLDPITHKRNRQLALNETLRRLAKGDPARSMARLEEERQIIQLTLSAGADPNCACPYDMSESILDSFLYFKKAYGALEVAKSDSFTRPKTLDNTFGELAYSLSHYLKYGRLAPDLWDTQEECDLYKRDIADKIDLVYVLFSKGMKPDNPRILKALQPLYEKEQERRFVNMPPAKQIGVGR